jgi:hypothetical protein
MRRLWGTVLVVLALVVSAGAAGPAGAQEAALDQFDPAAVVSLFPDDGGTCTGVPDAIRGVFDFTDACAAHDACYRSGEDQATCDETFRHDMVAECMAQHPSAFDPARHACLTFAQLYYFGVRLFGQFFI